MDEPFPGQYVSDRYPCEFDMDTLPGSLDNNYGLSFAARLLVSLGVIRPRNGGAM
jgi:hypothetical protein